MCSAVRYGGPQGDAEEGKEEKMREGMESDFVQRIMRRAVLGLQTS